MNEKNSKSDERKNETQLSVWLPAAFVDQVWEHIKSRNEKNPMHKITMRELIFTAINDYLYKN